MFRWEVYGFPKLFIFSDSTGLAGNVKTRGNPQQQ